MKQLAAIAILGLWSWSAQAQTACQGSLPQTETLLVNGTTAAGSVVVSNDTANLIVMVSTTGDWTISRLDLAVAATLAGIPQNSGQPDLSHFPYRQTFSPEVTSHTFMVPLPTTVLPTTVYVALHASLDSRTQGHQQAWAGGVLSSLFPCSQACTSGGRCGGDDGDDSAHLNDGGGDGCHGDDGQRGLPLHGSGIFDDGHGGQQQCGGSGDDDHGDHQGITPLWGGGGDGGGDGSNSCGGSGGGHGDHNHLQNGGGDGGGGDHHHDGGSSSDCQAGCGAMYFTYQANCRPIE